MPRNGLGTYSLPAGQPVVTGTTISSSTFNTLTSDLATALTQSLCIDGQAVPTANLGMGGFKITNAAVGTATTDVATLANFASPPAIGSTAPAAGAFTSVSATSGFTLTGGNTALNRPNGGTAATTLWTSEAVNVGYGLLYSAGSFRTTWSSNGYRNQNNQWTSLGINSSTGAATIEQDPTGVIIFSADTSKATGSSSSPTERVRITPNGLQIGTTTETSDLGIYSATGPTARITGNNASYFSNRTFSNTVGNAPWFQCTKGGGTLASPNALAVNDVIGGMQWYGYTGASSLAETARISVIAEGTFSSATAAASAIVFSTNISGTGLTEAARFNSSGAFLLSTTTTAMGSGNTANTGTAMTSGGVISSASSGAASLNLNRLTSDGGTAAFYRAGTLVGGINVTATATTYSTSSDYRLKTNVQPFVNALRTVAKLKPVTYDWKVNGQHSQGFIAHELAEVVPDAVAGQKDAVDDNGGIQPQSVDYSKLVVFLTAAIQEQQAAIVALEARLAALEPA